MFNIEFDFSEIEALEKKMENIGKGGLASFREGRVTLRKHGLKQTNAGEYTFSDSRRTFSSEQEAQKVLEHKLQRALDDVLGT